MIIHKKVIKIWKLIYVRRRTQQIKDNEVENRSRTNHKYNDGDMVRIITTTRGEKLIGFEHPGPYDVTNVHDN